MEEEGIYMICTQNVRTINQRINPVKSSCMLRQTQRDFRRVIEFESSDAGAFIALKVDQNRIHSWRRIIIRAQIHFSGAHGIIQL